MRVSTQALIAACSAVACATENVTVSDLIVRNIGNAVYSAEFLLSNSTANVTCTGNADTLKAGGFDSIFVCGGLYSIYIEEIKLDSYNLTVYKPVEEFIGIEGFKAINTTCRAGGSAADDYVCQQQLSKVSITLA